MSSHSRGKQVPSAVDLFEMHVDPMFTMLVVAAIVAYLLWFVVLLVTHRSEDDYFAWAARQTKTKRSD